jgi:trans-aconitate 2-methyltransferase
MKDWNSAQYLKFESQRDTACCDLAKRIGLAHPGNIIDIGCGPGNSNKCFAGALPRADILGIDSSENLLEKARANYPELSFKRCNAETELGRSASGTMFAFSNACIQWIPNQRELIRNMLNLLNENGVLAVQIPMTDREPLFKIFMIWCCKPRWGFGQLEFQTVPTLTPEEYLHILSDLSSDFDIWKRPYYHRMPNHTALLEWVKGTRLRPYLNAVG